MSPEVERAREMKRAGMRRREIADALGKPRWWVQDALYGIDRKPIAPETAAALRDLHTDKRQNHDEKALNAAVRLSARGERE